MLPMSAEFTADQPGSHGDQPLDKLCRQLLQRWREFPSAELSRLRALLEAALVRAEQAEPQILTVMSPVSRPARLQLAVVVDGTDLDSFYHREWAELSVDHTGVLYLVYRRVDGGDYAVRWSSATSVPTDMLPLIPPELALAMFEADGG